MSQIRNLDVFQVQLTEGAYLIEANAGTGKTFSIEILVLRFIIEKQIPLKKILITTFTKAATLELKKRIKAIMYQMYHQIEQQQLQESYRQILDQFSTKKEVIQTKLQQIIDTFHEVQIFTIHALFHKLINENYTISSIDPNAEIIENETELINKLTIQYWKKQVYTTEQLSVYFFLLHFDTPSKLINQIQFTTLPHITIVPKLDAAQFTKNNNELAQVYNELKTLWKNDKQAILEFYLAKRSTLKQQSYAYKHADVFETVLDNFTRLDTFSGQIEKPLIFILEHFTQERLLEKTKKNQIPIEHQIFEFISRFIILFDELRTAILWNATNFVKKESKRYKSIENKIYYNDMIITINDILKSNHGEVFIKKIQKSYDVAFVDEFQDTDFAQYNFFDSIFHHSGKYLYYIGDPKQSIYKFRGADVFTYRHAKESIDIQNHFVLNTNYRSNSGLIHAVNLIFQRETPFLLNFIDYNHSQCAQINTQNHISIESQPQIPFQIEIDEKTIPKERKLNQIAQSVTQDILHLIQNKTEIVYQGSKKNIQFNDIAILVQNHNQAKIMMQELSKFKLPIVLGRYDLLIETEEFSAVILLMNAIINNFDIRHIKAALSTTLFNISNCDIDALNQSYEKQKEYLQHFTQAFKIWNEKSFYSMIEFINETFALKSNLLSRTNGVRHLTNFEQTVECFQIMEIENHYTPTHLLKKIKTINPQNNDALCFQRVHRDNDQQAIHIITIHHSKGLEFPIVFCPFIVTETNRRNDKAFFHLEEEELPVLALNEKEKRNDLIQEENFSEQIRTVYVALTRAKLLLYLYIHGQMDQDKEKETNPFLYLMNISEGQKTIFEKFKEYAQQYTQDICVRSKDQKKIYPPYQDSIKEYLIPRQFNRKLKKQYSWNSFSNSIVKDKPFILYNDFASQTEKIDLNESQQTRSDSNTEALPFGIETGLCFHNIMEKISFDEHQNEIEKIVTQEVIRYGFPEELVASFQEKVFLTLNCSLSNSIHSFQIKNIPNNQILKEVAFHFKMHSFQEKKFIDLLEKHKEHHHNQFAQYLLEAINSGELITHQGYMRGFIDIVFCFQERFYIIDWKTNHIAKNTSNHQQDALYHYMRKNHYLLQYFIYAIALHQYLQLNLYNYSFEKHFGGVFYIFIRELKQFDENGHHHPNDVSGVYHDDLKNSQQLFIEISKYFTNKDI